MESANRALSTPRDRSVQTNRKSRGDTDMPITHNGVIHNRPFSATAPRSDVTRTYAFRNRSLAVALILATLLVSGWVRGSIAHAAVICGRRPNATHPAGRAARIRGWLHTCPDGTIRTRTGLKIRLNGVEYFRLGWGNTGAGRCAGH